MKMTKKVLSILLSLMLVLGTVAVGGMTASADGSVYEISSYADLKEFASRVNSGETGLNAKLMYDIDASGYTDWTPIGYYESYIDNCPFTGTFDGLGHKITGLTYNNPQQNCAGLFGYVGTKTEGGITTKGIVENVGLEGGSITGASYVGGVVGINYGTVTGCYNTGAVTATATADNADDYAHAGGVVGINYGTLTGCYNTGAVTATATDDNAYAGGVAGFNNNTLTNSYNTGNVTATATADNADADAYAGGVAGYNNDTLTNSYNTGAVTATATADNAYAYAGGVVGYNNQPLTNSYNTGAVTATATADNAYAYTYAYAGGVVGYNNRSLTNSYNTGNVSGNNYVGGVVGFNNNTLTNCYYDSDICTGVNAIGYGSGTNVTGLTTDLMTGESALNNMPGFTSDTWLTKANTNDIRFYPHLKGFAYDSEATVENWPPKFIYYPLWVGGNQVTTGNKGALENLDGITVAEGGSVTFVPDNDGTGGTLTLNNATITGSYSNAGILSSVSNLTIVLIGDNLIPNERGSGIFYYNVGKLTITGNGTLDVSTNAYTVYSDGTLTIDSTTVVANSDGYYSIFSDTALTIRNSYVSSESTGRCIWGNPLVLGEGLGITEPIGGQNDGRMITLNNQNVKKAVIQPAYSVELSANPSGGGTVSGGGFYAKDGSTATVTATPATGYRFVNWTENGDEVSTDAEYTFTVSGDRELVANFEIQKFTVQFVNDDGTELQSGQVIYGGTPAYTGEEPTKEATAQYTYSFLAWTPSIVPVTGNATYKATYSSTVNEYSVEFVNEDGTELQSGDVAYGETPVYTGETPTKEATAEYTYTFAGWSPEISSVTGDATYTATFTQAPRKYEIKFVNEDGTPLQSGQVIYGETPKYTGETPTKTATAEYTYEFKGWSPEISQVSGEATYTATFKEIPVDYKLTWTVDGESYKNETVPFGTEIVKPDDPVKEGYTFEWVDDIPATMPAGNVTIKGKFTPIEYTAKFVDEDGNTVKEVKFTVKTEKLDEPAVPEKTNYTGKWEDYTIGAADMTIKPVYTLGGETVVKAVDSENEVTSDYKETKEYNFETEYLPEGATTHVFVNGEDKGEGTSVTVEEPTEDYTVECKAFDADGNEIASSGEIKVKVKNSIFDKIKWFFSNLLKNFLDAIFGDFGKIC